MTMYTQNNPIIVQGDYSILLEVNNPAYASARNALVQFAELVKSPEYIHTYRITPLSIWNACAAGVRPETITRSLREYSKYDVPEHVVTGILDFASRYGRLTLSLDDRGLVLSADDPALAEEISRDRNVSAFLGESYTPLEFLVRPVDRGRLKQALVKAFPLPYARRSELFVEPHRGCGGFSGPSHSPEFVQRGPGDLLSPS